MIRLWITILFEIYNIFGKKVFYIVTQILSCFVTKNCYNSSGDVWFGLVTYDEKDLHLKTENKYSILFTI